VVPFGAIILIFFNFYAFARPFLFWITFPDPVAGFIIFWCIELPELPWDAFKLTTRFFKRASLYCNYNYKSLAFLSWIVLEAFFCYK
jgi:hypothetical protein